MSAESELTELYDVVIYEVSTRKIDRIIGTNMRKWDGTGTGRNTAELRQQTGRERCNDRYDAEIVPAGHYSAGDFIPPY